MSRERLAAAYDALAEAYGQVARELRANEPARVAVPESGGAGAAPPQRSPAPAAPRQDAALGYCPTHGVPWSVQPGGISKRTNKRYSAFWKCKEKDGDNYCNEKPVPVWADTHPAEEPPPSPRRSQAEDTDDLPF